LQKWDNFPGTKEINKNYHVTATGNKTVRMTNPLSHAGKEGGVIKIQN
jgi:hypothetical protein